MTQVSCKNPACSNTFKYTHKSREYCCKECMGTMTQEKDFEVGKHDLQFECGWAVFSQGSGSSICYVTSEERARFIVAALDYFRESGKMDEFFNQHTPQDQESTNDN